MCFEKIKGFFCKCPIISKFKKNGGCCSYNQCDPSNDSSSSEGCCKKGKCCKGKCVIKLIVLFGLFFIANTYLGFSNKAIDNYIQKNPKRIIESINNMMKNEGKDKKVNSEKAAKDQFKNIVKQSDLPYLGNKDGKNVIIEFFDYACGHCKRAHSDIKALLSTNQDLKVILMNTPILSEGSLDAARLSILAFEHLSYDKFIKFHDKMISYQGKINKTVALTILKSIAGPSDAAKIASVDSKTIDETIQKTYETMRELGAGGTPIFIINGKYYGGYISVDEMKQALND